MKTSEEMARSVMDRARAHRAAVRRRVFTAATAALCVCVLIISAVVFKPPGTNNSNPNASPIPITKVNIRPAKIGLVRYAEENKTPVELEQGMQTPHAMEVQVHDIRNKTEEEASALLQAKEQYVEELMDKGDTGNYFIHDSKNSIICCFCTGHFFIGIEDYKQVEDIRITLQGTGVLAWVNQLDEKEVYKNANTKEYYMDYWRVAIESYRNGGVSFVWLLSSETIHALSEDPTIPLSSCHDSIKVTVNMKDGSQQVGFIDIQVNDDGTVFATYRDNTTSD